MRLRNIILIILAVFAAFTGGSYLYFTRGLPPVKVLEDYKPDLVTKVYSRNGHVIGEFYIQRRVVVPLSRVPEHLIEAFLAAEDAEFYEHEGISIPGIVRAAIKNIEAGKIVQGGSTITQQLVKSLLFSPERKISRKVREAIMAYRIEKHLTKDEILAMYLNQIYLGNGAYGVQTAAETYFGKDVEELTLAEAALLAGLPKAPSKYSPYTNLDLAKGRQRFVLKRMIEEEFIPPEVAAGAASTELKLRPKEIKTLWIGPYFTEHVRRYIEENYGYDQLYRGGLKVYTTMDVRMQKAANLAVAEGLREYDRRRGYRGPLTRIEDPEKIEEFKAIIDEEIGDKGLEVGETYKAVVTELTSKGALRVEIGSRAAYVSRRYLRWTKLYNPSGEPDAGTRVSLDKVFHPGDVIEVSPRWVPADPESPVPVQVEQTPLAQAALLAMEPSTGFVRAMVGGNSFSETQYNRAIQAKRQPGSSFKAVIYSAALDSGYTPASIIVDSPLVFEEAEADEEKDASGVQKINAEELEPKWRPRNYDEKFRGPITVREAVTKSRNVVTIKVLNDIGVDTAIEHARRMGIESPLARDLSLALGSSAVSLEEMTTAFATLANLGMRPKPTFITKIEDKNGNVVEDNSPAMTPALSPQTAYLMTSLLQSVVQDGTGWRARALKRPVAGKTGTTNNLNDAWFLGFTPDLVAGSWVGYDEEKKLGRYETGSRAACPIWLKFMKDVTDGTEVKNFPMPDGLEFAKIDPETGLLAGPFTKEAVFEVFKEGSTPTRTSKATDRGGAKDFFLMDTGYGGGPEPMPEDIPDEEDLAEEAGTLDQREAEGLYGEEEVPEPMITEDVFRDAAERSARGDSTESSSKKEKAVKEPEQEPGKKEKKSLFEKLFGGKD